MGDIGELPEQLADHGLPRTELDRADPRGLEHAVTIEGYALAKQMSLDEVARASGISTERLLAIFRGDFDPDLGLIGQIAEILGVAASGLLAEPDFN